MQHCFIVLAYKTGIVLVSGVAEAMTWAVNCLVAGAVCTVLAGF